MNGLHPHDTSTASKIIRPLSPYERLFWAVDQVHGFNFCVSYSFRGTVSRARWIAAFADVQKRHPLLNAGVNLDDPHAPAFVRHAPSPPIPLTFIERSSPTQWQRVMEAEFARPFDTSSQPLLRATLLEDSDGCDLVLTAHHVALDGMGTAVLVRDLMAALCDERLLPLPAPLAAEAHLVRVRPPGGSSAETASASDNADRAIAALPARKIARRIGSGSPIIDALGFSQQETAQLIRCARREETTVGSALIAALADALRALAPELATADIRFTAPIDVRPYFGNTDDFVLSINNARGVSPHPAGDLWQSARAIRPQLMAFQSLLEIEATFDRVQQVMAMNLESTVLVDALASLVGHDLLLSNLKVIELPTMPGGLTLEAVWGPSVLLGLQGEHMIGSASCNGALRLLYTSFSPIAGLLERVQQTLGKACADA